MDVIDLLYSVFLVMTLPYAEVTLYIMSSFQPNDYLYDVMSSMYGLDSNMKLELEKINKLTNDIYSIKDYFNIFQRE